MATGAKVCRQFCSTGERRFLRLSRLLVRVNASIESVLIGMGVELLFLFVNGFVGVLRNTVENPAL
jgi:hypothetical protein